MKHSRNQRKAYQRTHHRSFFFVIPGSHDNCGQDVRCRNEPHTDNSRKPKRKQATRSRDRALGGGGGGGRRVGLGADDEAAVIRDGGGLGLGAAVDGGVEAVGRGVGGEPLADVEEGLGAEGVGPSGGDLHVLAVPAVVGAGAVGGEVEAAERRGQAAGPAAAEGVEGASLVVVVVGAHEAAPRHQVRHRHLPPRRVPQRQPDGGVRPPLEHRPRPHVHRVHALILLLCHSIRSHHSHTHADTTRSQISGQEEAYLGGDERDDGEDEAEEKHAVSDQASSTHLSIACNPPLWRQG